MAECDLQEKERISQNLKVHLNEWKELIILLNEIIEQKIIWYFVVTVICLTSSYLYIWFVNCSTLNIIWTVCLCASLLDCFVCGPLKKILPLNSGDQDKEHIYADISDSVAQYYVNLKLYTARFFSLRQSNRRLFHSVLVALFCTLLYIGKTFNNLMVSYLTVLVIFLLPVFNTRNHLWFKKKLTT